MHRSAPDNTASLQAYPNLSAAAKLIGVSASTLSRRKDLVAESRGERDRVVPAAEVLRLAAVYRRRSLNDVAQDLIDHAAKTSRDDAARVETEIEVFFENRAISDKRREDLLVLARQFLPEPLYKEVEATVSDEGAALPEGLIGYTPLRES